MTDQKKLRRQALYRQCFRSPPKHRAPKARARHRWSRSTVRALRASTLISVGLAGLLIAQSVAPNPSAPSDSASPEGKRLSETFMETLWNGGDVIDDDGVLPPWFEEEFFSPNAYFDFRCNRENTVMSLSSDQTAPAALRGITAEMRQRGWTAISAGSPTMKTMIRKEGMHSWALIWSEAVGGQSTIVVQTLPVR